MATCSNPSKILFRCAGEKYNANNLSIKIITTKNITTKNITTKNININITTKNITTKNKNMDDFF